MTYCPIHRGYHGGECEDMHVLDLDTEIRQRIKGFMAIGILIGAILGFYLGRFS